MFSWGRWMRKSSRGSWTKWLVSFLTYRRHLQKSSRNWWRTKLAKRNYSSGCAMQLILILISKKWWRISLLPAMVSSSITLHFCFNSASPSSLISLNMVHLLARLTVSTYLPTTMLRKQRTLKRLRWVTKIRLRATWMDLKLIWLSLGLPLIRWLMDLVLWMKETLNSSHLLTLSQSAFSWCICL